jgi:hypothetical protein
MLNYGLLEVLFLYLLNSRSINNKFFRLLAIRRWLEIRGLAG